MGFLHPTQNLQGQNYQVNQSLIAIGSGGLWGVGYGQSATKDSYLPTPIDDSIFAVVAEELGFIGAGALSRSLRSSRSACSGSRSARATSSAA